MVNNGGIKFAGFGYLTLKFQFDGSTNMATVGLDSYNVLVIIFGRLIIIIIIDYVRVTDGDRVYQNAEFGS